MQYVAILVAFVMNIVECLDFLSERALCAESEVIVENFIEFIFVSIMNKRNSATFVVIFFNIASWPIGYDQSVVSVVIF